MASFYSNPTKIQKLLQTGNLNPTYRIQNNTLQLTYSSHLIAFSFPATFSFPNIPSLQDRPKTWPTARDINNTISGASCSQNSQGTSKTQEMLRFGEEEVLDTIYLSHQLRTILRSRCIDTESLKQLQHLQQKPGVS